MNIRTFIALSVASFAALAANAANPFLPLWEYIPDGEPHVFEDPDNPGKMRVYLYGSHDVNGRHYCGFDLVVWSAPVDELNNWRYDGVIFESKSDANGESFLPNGGSDHLLAPDVAMTVGKDGKKIYWLYPNIVGVRKSLVAKSDSPKGPFVPCNWSPDDPAKTVGCMGFDPAVLVDDDGRVYGFWGGGHSHAAELDPATMATVKPGTKILSDLVAGCGDEGIGGFYEASSIRKVKDKYAFIYCRWTKDGDFGMTNSNYTLAYAYSDRPLGPYTYGGTIIDGRGREKRGDGSVVATAHPNGNTHGSICEINGKWYVFYHRQTGTNPFSRQAMVAPIEVSVEDKPGGRIVISEAEYTSEGFESGGLDPYERHVAGIASHYTGPEPAVTGTGKERSKFVFPGPYTEPFRCKTGYSAVNPYDPSINCCRIVNCTDGSTVGYKYFDFSRTCGRCGLKLCVELELSGVGGRIDVWIGRPATEEGGVLIGSATLDAEAGVRTIEIPVVRLSEITGRKALYFTFSSDVKGRSICSVESFAFSCSAML